MQHLLRKNIRNLILTSGTLTPLKPLIAELGIPNPVLLTSQHIIKEFQIFAEVVGIGPKGIAHNSSYNNR